MVLAKVTDFFLGLNAGQWLKIRLEQISTESQQQLLVQQSAAATSAERTEAATCHQTAARSSTTAQNDHRDHHQQQQQQGQQQGCCVQLSVFEEMLLGTGYELREGVEPPTGAQPHKFELGTSFVRATSDDWETAA